MNPAASNPHSRATIRDVADLARVSRQTVSNVLNRPEIVRPETLSRVRSAIDALSYVPDAAARQLRKGSRIVIGLRVTPLDDPGDVLAFLTACIACPAALDTLVIPIGSHATKTLADRAVDFVITTGSGSTPSPPEHTFAEAAPLGPNPFDPVHRLTYGLSELHKMGVQPVAVPAGITTALSAVKRLARERDLLLPSLAREPRIAANAIVLNEREVTLYGATVPRVMRMPFPWDETATAFLLELKKSSS